MDIWISLFYIFFLHSNQSNTMPWLQAKENTLAYEWLQIELIQAHRGVKYIGGEKLTEGNQSKHQFHIDTVNSAP